MAISFQFIDLFRKAISTGDQSSILKLTSETRETSKYNHETQVEVAILLRDAGYFDISSEICTQILESNENHPAALYELATLEAMRGRHVEALINLERLLILNPCDERSLCFAARISARIGDYAMARNYLQQADESFPDHPDVAWLKELVSFMQAFPSGVADRLTQIHERDRHYTFAGTIAGWASAAVQAKEGFSLIRLGDGEGAFCRISSEDEVKYPRLYDHCRQNRARVWFSDEIDIHRSGFTKTAFTLRNAIQNANVVGIPYRNWVEHEYKYCSATGIVGLVNALRITQLPSVKKNQSWTTQLVHIDLLQQGILENLVRQHKRISLISCLSEAADVLKRFFDLEEVVLYRIPGEKLHKDQLGDETSVGQHYPDRYNELMTELKKPLHGRLFLVAGGLLGKIYCNHIKMSGGVALDIGTVVDTWMGKATRPGANLIYMLK